MTIPTVQIDGLTKSFGSFRALSGVSFSTGTGVTGLLGPNGAGKTTLLRIAATVLGPDSGRLRLLGRVPAQPDERLALRRRLGLAQALLREPDLLVLDEPTAGLDPEQRLRFRELVSEIGEHRTVLLSTHQTEDVATLCHRVVVLTGGEVRFDGSVPALADLARGRVWISDRREPGARLAWRTGDGRARNIGEPPAGADLAEPTIEDAYLLLAGEMPAEMAA